MSADVIGMVIALFAFAVSVLGGVAAMLTRQTKTIDVKLDALEGRVNQRFDRVDDRIDRMDGRLDRMDDRFDRIDDRLTRVESELVEVKVAIARIEGPRPRLQQL